MKFADFMGERLRDIRINLDHNEVKLIFDIGVLKMGAGIYGSAEHPDGVAELRMSVQGAAADDSEGS